MSVTSGFFNSLSGDRKYDAIQISSMFDGLITDGIYNGFLESFMVTASDPASMVVTVGEGRCWFNHTWTLNDAPLPLTLDVGDVVLNRIDTIVIDVDSTDTVRACMIKVVKGTPSSQAVRPTLENTETHHQYPLCDISVVAGATTVTQSNITNRRGTSDCPFVATLMTTVTVDELLVQWESQWNDWMTDRANSMDSWTAEQQEAFTTWFQTVQDILDENTAGNLLNRINHRTGINATATYSAGVVAITAPDDAGEILTFVAPSDFLSSDTYTLNGEALTITDLNGEALDDSWKKNSPVTITVSGGKAFFKAGGSGKNDTLPPLLGNMTVEVVEGDENDTYIIKMDKLILDKTTEMVGGAQLEWGEEMPAKPGKGTGGIKTWTRDEVITTAKPYDDMDAATSAFYLSTSGNVTSTAVTSNMVLNPSLSFDLTTPIRALPDGTYDLVPEDPALSGTTKSISVMAETSGTPIQLKDIPVSDADNTSTLILPEKSSEQAYIYVSENYEETGAACAFRGISTDDSQMRYRGDSFAIYIGNGNAKNYCDAFVENYLDASVLPYVVTADINSYQALSSVMQTVSANAFPLAAYEMGYTDLDAAIQAEGPLLPYFDGPTARADERNYYTRTGRNASNVVYVTSGGGMSYMKESSSSAYIRPAILLSPETWFTDNGDGTYTFVGDEPASSEFVSHTVEVPHGQKVVFRQFTQNQKKQFQTMLVGGVYPPLGDVEEPFVLPEFTGNHAIFGDETAGRIELYESGDLTLSPGTYDFFAVGGGGGGCGRYSEKGGGGGGSGYTKTVIGYSTPNQITCDVVVGAGGGIESSGSASFVNAPTGTPIITANGGGVKSGGLKSQGGNGGSGGGGGGTRNLGGNGGSDGSNGIKGISGSAMQAAVSPGSGQGTTTRMFEEPESTLYAGGGAGGYYASKGVGDPGLQEGRGGAGGGGNGAGDTAATPGTPNTGGGGGGGGSSSGKNPAAGGSGIIIIRWNNA